MSAKLYGHKMSPPNFFNAAFIHSDIDECENGDDDCRQVCNNTPGSYECSCYSGYFLRSDSQSCEGEQAACKSHDVT